MPYKDIEAQRRYQREWVAARRTRWLADKNCVHCGATDDLEVHHCDEASKESHRIWSWSDKRREAELAKCEVLCGTCHDRFHGERRRVPCGTASSYRRGCRCNACRLAKAAYARAAA